MIADGGDAFFLSHQLLLTMSIVHMLLVLGVSSWNRSICFFIAPLMAQQMAGE